jgi:hypothetical protein
MIAAVQRHIYDALAKTMPGSTLPEEEQDMLLAQACAEACGILGDWTSSSYWAEYAPSGRKPIAEITADLERVKPFLEPLRETIDRISKQPGAPGIGDSVRYIDEMISTARHTARRHRRMTGEELYKVARERLDALQDGVCKIASDFRKGGDATKRAKRRSLARKILPVIASVLLSVGLAMASAGPSAVRQNIPQWGHDAVQVLVVHHVAHTAAPTVRIAPPHAGPHVGLCLLELAELEIEGRLVGRGQRGDALTPGQPGHLPVLDDVP